MLLPRQRFKLARGTKDKEHAMSEKLNTAIAVIGAELRARMTEALLGASRWRKRPRLTNVPKTAYRFS